MRSKLNRGIWVGIFFLLAQIFLLFSGYIIPGRDPDIGGFQLASVLFCAVAALSAFDFALLLPRHFSLRMLDWFVSVALLFAGVMILSTSNILRELLLVEKSFQPAMTSINYIGSIMMISGIYWRFQIQLDAASRNIVASFKRILVSRVLRKYITNLLFVALGMFLLVGVIFAYNETPSVEVILNPFRLLFLCLSLFLVGRSLLRFFLGGDQPLALQMLAPLAGMTLWALVLGFGVALRIPVSQISIPLWGLTIFLAWRGFNRDALRVTVPMVTVAMILALLATFPYALSGFSVYMGSPLPDGWSYIAYGQYLWEYPRGLNSGLQPLYQYTAHLSNTRYIGSSLLGFLSPVTGHAGDTQSASGFFFSVVLFIYSSSIVACALNKFTTFFLRATFILLAALSGWTFTVISSNNLDQALVLAFLPALAILVGSPHFDRPRWVILVAAILAACAYIYVEMTIFIVFTIALLSFEQFLRQGLPWRHWLLGGISILLLVTILLSPFLSELLSFFLAQLDIASRSSRPGNGMFLELLSSTYGFIALWGGGANLFSTSAEFLWYNLRAGLSYFFGACLLIGILLQIKRRKFGTFGVTIFFGAIIYYYLYSQNYPYAAYKIISISWWLFIALVVEGLQFVLSTRRYFIKSIFQIILLNVLLCFSAVFFIRSNLFANSFDEKSIVPFRQLETLPVSDDEPVIISVWGWLPNEWAMYYLRQRPTLIYPYRSYASQPHVIPFMEQAATLDFGKVRAILTDHANPFFPSQDVLWQNQIYTLWKMPTKWAYVAEVINSYGVVAVNQPNTLWLNNEKTDIVILASRSGNFSFSFDVQANSDLTNVSDYYAFIVAPSGEETTLKLTEDHQTITLPFIEGKNQISIQLLNQSSVSTVPNNDPEKYPLRITNVELIPSP